MNKAKRNRPERIAIRMDTLRLGWDMIAPEI